MMTPLELEDFSKTISRGFLEDFEEISNESTDFSSSGSFSSEVSTKSIIIAFDVLHSGFYSGKRIPEITKEKLLNLAREIEEDIVILDDIPNKKKKKLPDFIRSFSRFFSNIKSR